jgi:hypothetical protein
MSRLQVKVKVKSQKRMETTMKNYTLNTLGISALFVAGVSLLVIGPASTLAAQSYRQLPPPRYNPPPPSASAPQQRSTQPQSNSVPQQQHAAESSTRTQPQRTSQSAPVQSHAAQEQARQQKEQQKIQQKQEQEQARKQKDFEKITQKQEQQKAREQKQQQKLRDKQQKEQEKEMARQEKSNKKQEKVASIATRSSGGEASSTHSEATSSGNSAMVDSKNAAGGSRDMLSQLNASRSGMKGVNSKPLPSGDIALHENGSMTLKAAGDRQYGLRANGTISSFSANGKSANFNSRGKVIAIHTASMDIRRGANGRRLVVSHGSDNTTVVATSHLSGYIQRTFQRENRTYIQRTVVLNSRIVTRTYVVYGYRGLALPHFVSPVFYSPVFYGWAFYPWPAPVPYTWGWFGEPWYFGPHPYFVAYPIYASANFWLTDYYLGQTLSAAYHEQQDALADGDSYAFDQDDVNSLQAPEATPITPELKAAIADEVREQIAAENTAAANPEKATSYGELPSILNKGNYVFVVADDLNVTTPEQQECALQAGDTLQLTTPASDSLSLVQLRVTSSKILDCPAGVQVLVSLQDLQDMQNNFRTQIASGLGTLQAKQGTDGLPSAPPETLSIPPQTGIEPLSSAQAVSMLDSEIRQADALELEMTDSAGEAF